MKSCSTVKTNASNTNTINAFTDMISNSSFSGTITKANSNDDGIFPEDSKTSPRERNGDNKVSQYDQFPIVGQPDLRSILKKPNSAINCKTSNVEPTSKQPSFSSMTTASVTSSNSPSITNNSSSHCTSSSKTVTFNQTVIVFCEEIEIPSSPTDELDDPYFTFEENRESEEFGDQLPLPPPLDYTISAHDSSDTESSTNFNIDSILLDDEDQPRTLFTSRNNGTGSKGIESKRFSSSNHNNQFNALTIDPKPILSINDDNNNLNHKNSNNIQHELYANIVKANCVEESHDKVNDNISSIKQDETQPKSITTTSSTRRSMPARVKVSTVEATNFPKATLSQRKPNPDLSVSPIRRDNKPVATVCSPTSSSASLSTIRIENEKYLPFDDNGGSDKSQTKPKNLVHKPVGSIANKQIDASELAQASSHIGVTSGQRQDTYRQRQKANLTSANNITTTPETVSANQLFISGCHSKTNRQSNTIDDRYTNIGTFVGYNQQPIQNQFVVSKSYNNLASSSNFCHACRALDSSKQNQVDTENFSSIASSSLGNAYNTGLDHQIEHKSASLSRNRASLIESTTDVEISDRVDCKHAAVDSQSQKHSTPMTESQQTTRKTPIVFNQNCIPCCEAANKASMIRTVCGNQLLKQHQFMTGNQSSPQVYQIVYAIDQNGERVKALSLVRPSCLPNGTVLQRTPVLPTHVVNNGRLVAMKPSSVTESNPSLLIPDYNSMNQQKHQISLSNSNSCITGVLHQQSLNQQHIQQASDVKHNLRQVCNQKQMLPQLSENFNNSEQRINTNDPNGQLKTVPIKLDNSTSLSKHNTLLIRNNNTNNIVGTFTLISTGNQKGATRADINYNQHNSLPHPYPTDNNHQNQQQLYSKHSNCSLDHNHNPQRAQHTIYYVSQPLEGTSLDSIQPRSFPDPHEIRKLDGLKAPPNRQNLVNSSSCDQNHSMDPTQAGDNSNLFKMSPSINDSLGTMPHDETEDPSFGFSKRPEVKVVTTTAGNFRSI